ncbi:hypothetical protein HDU96_010226 [Phlyctochytrium bullatum]|nr:hypothetical protein HDU96_010226 [Phlyctochytrium bullatum]
MSGQADPLLLVPPCVLGSEHKWYGKSHDHEGRVFAGAIDSIDPSGLRLDASNGYHDEPQQSSNTEASSKRASSAGGGSKQPENPNTQLAAACAAGDVFALLNILGLDSSKAYSRSPTEGSSQTPKTTISVNKPVNSAGSLPLHIAASRGHIEVVVMLIDRAGALTDMPDSQNETALLKAAYNGHSDVITFLLDRNADPNHKDNDEWTPLHNACSRGHYFAAKILIEGGAEVNSQSKTGFTPLMNAASKGFIDIVQLLLQSFADPLIPNNFGEYAYDLAAQSEETYTCGILLEAERRKLTGSRSQQDSRPPEHQSVLEVVFENQRSALFSSSRFSAEYLAKTDVPPWMYARNGSEIQLGDVSLPGEWFWLSDWKVDLRYPNVNSEGWQYARDFNAPESSWASTPKGSTIVSGWVRRRRWIRVRKRRVNADDSVGISSKGLRPSVEMESSSQSVRRPSLIITKAQEADYIVRAEWTLQDLRSAVLKASDPVGKLKEDLRRYEEAIQIVLSGMKSI